MYRTTETPSRELRIVEHLLTGPEAGPRSPVEDALFDPVTQLPTLHLLLKQIRSTLSERSQVGVLSLHVSPFVKLEELFGWETFDAVLRTIAEMLQEIKKECLRESDSVAELSMVGGNFVFVLSPPRYNQSVKYDDLDKLRQRIQALLRAKLAERFPAEVCAQFGAFVGCVVINHDPATSIDRLILRGLDAAYTDAFQERERELQNRRQGLERVIAGRTISTVYQPIVDIQEQRILGYEAFTRGPPGDFANPEYLFKLAYQTRLLWQLERLCRAKAVARIGDLPRDCLLFLNVDPESLLDPELSEWSRAENLAGRVVLEVTERAGVDDYILFRRSLDLIQSLGLRVAIDDVGSAYSGLRVIAEARPHFIKVDMGLTRGLHDDVVRQQLVGAIGAFAERVGSPLIAEGVETIEELEALRSMGVRYVQGYLLGRPAAEFAQVDFDVLRPASPGKARSGKRARRAGTAPRRSQR